MDKAKAWVALGASAAGEALTLGLVPDSWKWVAAAVTAMGVTGAVYRVPNRE